MESDAPILAFVPNSLDTTKFGYLKGFGEKCNNTNVFYVTSSTLEERHSRNTIGYYGKLPPHKVRNKPTASGGSLHLVTVPECPGTLQGNTLTTTNNDDIVFILYDYASFCKTHVPLSKSHLYGEHLTRLSKEIKKSHKKDEPCKHTSNMFNFVSHKILFTAMKMLTAILSLLTRVCEATALVLPFSSTVAQCREDLHRLGGGTCPPTANALTSKLADVALGAALLHWLRWWWSASTTTGEPDDNQKLGLLVQSAETMIEQLRSLLGSLMGSPAGLKLNHALNKTMGSVFLYHLLLWRTFLQVVRPMLELGGGSLLRPLLPVLSKFLLCGGLRVQVALVADVLALFTFHVYCIYVYAARLYGAQVRALTSLWRMLLGAKHNPLRQRVDMHRYTRHQLFLGTLAFTILLFLLPTTLLYYAVFATLRLLLLGVGTTLRHAGSLAQRLPLYELTLSAMGCCPIRGTAYMELMPLQGVGKEPHTLAVQLTLRQEGSVAAAGDCTLDESSVHTRSWSKLLHSVLVGDIL